VERPARVLQNSALLALLLGAPGIAPDPSVTLFDDHGRLLAEGAPDVPSPDDGDPPGGTNIGC
jgi:hypothetical protein